MEIIGRNIHDDIRLVAESVHSVHQKLDRTAQALDEKIDATTLETHALIRFSHASLDRRLRTVEESTR